MGYYFINKADITWHIEDVRYWHVHGDSGHVMLCCHCVNDNDIDMADCVISDCKTVWLLFESLNDCLQTDSSGRVSLGYAVVYQSGSVLIYDRLDIWFCTNEQPFVKVDASVFWDVRRVIAASVKAGQDIETNQCLSFALAFLCNLVTKDYMLKWKSFVNVQTHGLFDYLRYLQMYLNEMNVGSVYTCLLFEESSEYILNVINAGYAVLLSIDVGVELLRVYGIQVTKSRHAVCLLRLSNGYYVMVDPCGCMVVSYRWLQMFLNSCMSKSFESNQVVIMAGVLCQGEDMTYDELLYEVKAVENEVVVKVDPYTGNDVSKSGSQGLFRIANSPSLDINLFASDAELVLRDFYRDNVDWFTRSETYLRLSNHEEVVYMDFVEDNEMIEEFGVSSFVSRDLLFPLDEFELKSNKSTDFTLEL